MMGETKTDSSLPNATTNAEISNAESHDLYKLNCAFSAISKECYSHCCFFSFKSSRKQGQSKSINIHTIRGGDNWGAICSKIWVALLPQIYHVYQPYSTSCSILHSRISSWSQGLTAPKCSYQLPWNSVLTFIFSESSTTKWFLKAICKRG